MKVTVLPPIAAAGTHKMRLDRRATVEGQFNKPAICWAFVGDGGSAAGHEVTKLTGTTLRIGESLADFLTQVGVDVAVGGQVDIDEPIGGSFEVSIAARKDGSVYIARITPIKAAS